MASKFLRSKSKKIEEAENKFIMISKRKSTSSKKEEEEYTNKNVQNKLDLSRTFDAILENSGAVNSPSKEPSQDSSGSEDMFEFMKSKIE